MDLTIDLSFPITLSAFPAARRMGHEQELCRLVPGRGKLNDAKLFFSRSFIQNIVRRRGSKGLGYWHRRQEINQMTVY